MVEKFTKEVCRWVLKQKWRHSQEAVDHLFRPVHRLGRTEFLKELFKCEDMDVLLGAIALELLYASYYCHNMYVDTKGLARHLQPSRLLAATRELEEAGIAFTEYSFGAAAAGLVERSVDLEYRAFIYDTQPLRLVSKTHTNAESLFFLMQRNTFMNAQTPYVITCIISQRKGLDPKQYARISFAYGHIQQMVNDIADMAWWVATAATREKTNEDIYADFRNGRYTTVSHALVLSGKYGSPTDVLLSQQQLLERGLGAAEESEIIRDAMFHCVAFKEWLKQNVASEEFTGVFSLLVRTYLSTKYMHYRALEDVRRELRNADAMKRWAESRYGDVRVVFEAIDQLYNMMQEELGQVRHRAGKI